MSSIARKAQIDFEFATIYEQRKTNQLLVAGFTNLAQALAGMGQSIALSIEDLSGQVSHMTEALEGVHTTMKDHSEALETHNDLALARHDRALEMLDNIQRRRRPRPEEFRDGEY